MKALAKTKDERQLALKLTCWKYRRRYPGHGRTIIALSPVSRRHYPELGWQVDCKCGWSFDHIGSYTDAKAFYADHLANCTPICRCSAPISEDRQKSKNRPHLCTSCVRAEQEKWVSANREQLEDGKWRFYLKNTYGITVEQYNDMLSSQNGLCAICELPVGDKRHFRGHIDHCHKTGKVRSILCGRCNRGLGQFRDDIPLLQRVIKYLEKHSGEVPA